MGLLATNVVQLDHIDDKDVAIFAMIMLMTKHPSTSDQRYQDDVIENHFPSSHREKAANDAGITTYQISKNGTGPR